MSNRVVFIHGLGGSAESTWGDFKDLILGDKNITGQYLINFYQYPTKIFRLPFTSKVPAIGQLAKGLRTTIEIKYPDDKEIILVCHSLGGLVARQYLLELIKSKEYNRKHRVLLYCTPNDGADLARVGSLLSWRHYQLRQACKESDFINSLNEDWVRFKMNEIIDV